MTNLSDKKTSANRVEKEEARTNGQIGKNGQIDHLIPEQIDHRFRFKMTT